MRSFLDAIQCFRKKPMTHVLTVLILAIALILPSGLAIGILTFNKIVPNWRSGTTLSLYVPGSISSSNLMNLKKLLVKIPGVLKVNYISPDQGLENLSKSVHLFDVKKMLVSNPLPGVLLVKPSLNINTAKKVEALYNIIHKLPGVEPSNTDQRSMQRLYGIMHILTGISYVLICIFSFGVVLIVVNTVRLQLERRKQDFTIMKLLGIRRSCIRLPSIYLGFLYGLMASVLAIVFYVFFFLWYHNAIRQLMLLYGTHLNVSMGVIFSACFVLLGFGCLLTTFGAYYSTKKI